MATDSEKIQECILEMARENGSVAVQTITFMMQKLLQTESDITIHEASHHLDLIMNTSHTIAEDPELWTYQQRYSGALFDRHFLQGHNDLIDFYLDLGKVILKLDSIYQHYFNVENAQNYLYEVERTAGMLQKCLLPHEEATGAHFTIT